MLIRTEQTPNPATRKFLPGAAGDGRRQPRLSRRRSGRRPRRSPPRLFATGMVEGVFFGRDFISVTAAPGRRLGRRSSPTSSASCSTISSAARHCSPPAPRPASRSPTSAAFEEDPADAEIIDQIKELIETRVRPAVAQDGGDIVYRGYKDGTLYLAMQGACQGCPSSAMTLKSGIESLIRHYVPEVETVEAV